MIEVLPPPLSGKKGLVLGIANEHSIAFGCAKGFRALGADLAITYLNEKAKHFVDRSRTSSARRFSCRAM